jgi:hypothetical protein
MQRMLVGLVLFLTLAVGVMAILMLDLQDRVDSVSGTRPGTAPARRTGGGDAHPIQVSTLEARIDSLLKQIEELRKEQRNTVSLLSRTPTTSTKSTERIPAEVTTEPGLAGAERHAGDIRVTEQDEAFYLAVKESVDRKRRIEAQVDNTMRRIDRLAEQNAIQPVEGEARRKVERAIVKYTAAADDLLTRYFRKPNDQLKAMPVDQRREAVRSERDTIVATATQELTAAVGQADAEVIHEKLLKNVRRIQRTAADGEGFRGRRGRGR